MAATLKSRNFDFNKLIISNNNPGPGAYDLSTSAKLVNRRMPTLMYKLPILATSSKGFKENDGSQFYENKISLNATGKYPLSRVPNYNAPLMNAIAVIHKTNG